MLNHTKMGSRIKKSRKEMKLTQAKLADILFISESYLALIETDRRLPSTELLITISKTLGVSIEYLIFGEKTDNLSPLFREWETLFQGKSQQEIKSAYNLVREFFKCIDEQK